MADPERRVPRGTIERPGTLRVAVKFDTSPRTAAVLPINPFLDRHRFIGFEDHAT